MENNLLDIEQMGVQNPSLKLIKNTKGYNWEIKLMNLDVDELERLNKEMIKRFGNE